MVKEEVTMKNGFNIDEDAYRRTIAANLTEALRLRDVSQRELASKIGVSSTTVSQWCQGKKAPRMDKIDAICALLNIKRSDLMLSKDERVIVEVKDDEIQRARRFARLNAYHKGMIEMMLNAAEQEEQKKRRVKRPRGGRLLV